MYCHSDGLGLQRATLAPAQEPLRRGIEQSEPLRFTRVLSAAGYAGSPLELELPSGSTNETLEYPDRMAIPGKKGIFGSPTYELYRFQTAVPPAKKSVTVRWSLSCQGKDGDPAGNFVGHFPLARSFTPGHPASRDICNHGGSEGIVLTVCNTALSEKLGACAFAIVTAGTGSKFLDIGSLAADPLSPRGPGSAGAAGAMTRRAVFEAPLMHLSRAGQGSSTVRDRKRGRFAENAGPARPPPTYLDFTLPPC